MKDKNIDESIQKLVKEDKIHILNENDEPVYEDKVKAVARKSMDTIKIEKDDSENSGNDSFENSDDDEEDVSPDVRSKTHLVIFTF